MFHVHNCRCHPSWGIEAFIYAFKKSEYKAQLILNYNHIKLKKQTITPGQNRKALLKPPLRCVCKQITHLYQTNITWDFFNNSVWCYDGVFSWLFACIEHHQFTLFQKLHSMKFKLTYIYIYFYCQATSSFRMFSMMWQENNKLK